MHRSGLQWGLILVLLLFVVGYAGVLFNGDPIRPSEANSINHTGFFQDDIYSPSQTLTSVHKNSPQHAPFFYVLLTEWFRLTSIHPIILRILPLYFALLTSAFVFRLGQNIDADWGGIIATTLVTFLSFNMFYAHEIRNYGMLAFTSAMVLWAYWRAINPKRKTKRLDLAWLYLSSVWCLYVHYFGIFLLFGIGVYHLIFVVKNRRWWQIAVVEILTGVTFLPWLPTVLRGSTADALNNEGWIKQNAFDVFVQHFIIFSNGLWFLLIGICCVVLWYIFRKSHKSQFAIYIITVTITMLIATIVANEVFNILPVRRMRYTMVWLPPIMLVATYGLVWLFKVPWLRGIALVVWIGSFFWFNQTTTYQDYTNITDQQSDKTPNYQLIVDDRDYLPGEGEVIVSVSSDTWTPVPILNFYQQLTGYEYLHLTDNLSLFGQPDNMYHFQVNNMRSIANDASFWVLTYPQYTDVETVNVFQAGLDNGARSCMMYADTATTRLEYYVRNDIPCELVTEAYPLIVYDNELVLLNLFTSITDGQLDIYTWWEQKPAEPFGFSIQLFDEAGNKVGQGDFLLPSGTIQINALDISELDAGTYNLMIAVYDVGTATTQSGTIVASDMAFDRIVTADTIIVE